MPDAGLVAERCQNLLRRADAHHQGRPHPGKCAAQVEQGFGHEAPLPRRGVGLRPSLGLDDEKRQDATAHRGGLREDGVILDPKIALEPNENILAHGAPDSSLGRPVKGVPCGPSARALA